MKGRGNLTHIDQQNDIRDAVSRNERRAAFLDEASNLPSLQLSDETMAWFELLAGGALAPLSRFMGSADATSVEREMRLANGTFFPVPVILPVNDAATYRTGQRVALRSRQNHLLALFTIEEVFEYTAGGHSTWAISGPMDVLQAPFSLLFPHLRESPAKLRSGLHSLDSERVLVADEWNPLDGAQTSWLRKMAASLDGRLLINLMMSQERLDDFELFQRLRRCESEYHEMLGPRAFLNLVSVPKMQPGARCLLLRALIHRNYGADVYLLTADAMTGFSGEEFAQWEAGIEALGLTTLSPETRWGASNASRRTLASLSTREAERGFCLWFTGLPGAGKSTIAEQVVVRLMENNRRVTLLDGDVVRTHLSKGLGFSRADRDTNVQRIGFVAAEIVRHGGVAVCAAVSPYGESRDRVREMMKPGAFVEIFVDTPVSICEQRDVKGFYTKARKGTMSSFTGVDDPYEAPEHAEIVLKTNQATPAEEAEKVMRYLLSHGHLEIPETKEEKDPAPRKKRLTGQTV
ncbi:adenylyl-sulfate kinase [Silvibacterium dinghuense]|nr:adenylyl-sulfate kinase [Silvibacterium dinghuense]